MGRRSAPKRSQATTCLIHNIPTKSSQSFRTKSVRPKSSNSVAAGRVSWNFFVEWLLFGEAFRQTAFQPNPHSAFGRKAFDQQVPTSLPPGRSVGTSSRTGSGSNAAGTCWSSGPKYYFSQFDSHGALVVLILRALGPSGLCGINAINYFFRLARGSRGSLGT